MLFHIFSDGSHEFHRCFGMGRHFSRFEGLFEFTPSAHQNKNSFFSKICECMVLCFFVLFGREFPFHFDVLVLFGSVAVFKHYIWLAFYGCALDQRVSRKLFRFFYIRFFYGRSNKYLRI
jgi:hypothetical protein